MPEFNIDIEWWVIIVRLIVATVLGFAIGFERKLRFKEAGLRTHSVISLGTCLLMLVSMYAFGSAQADKARVAAQIVTGIGFLGTGTIMFKRQSIHGLTTAAGILVTAGVGMAIGGGMYILGCVATILVILIQCFMHLPLKIFKSKRYMQLKICFENSTNENEIVKELFKVDIFTKVKAVKENDKVLFTVVLTTDKIYQDTYIHSVLVENPFIRSIERVEDE